VFQYIKFCVNISVKKDEKTDLARRICVNLPLKKTKSHSVELICVSKHKKSEKTSAEEN
jgi:hypothetical protein